jgi:hypothetical protein
MERAANFSVASAISKRGLDTRSRSPEIPGYGANAPNDNNAALVSFAPLFRLLNLYFCMPKSR